MNRPLLIEMPFKVNGYDIDVMGIVSNIVYIRWFEDMRFKFLDTHWPYEEMLENNQSPILSETRARYKKPLTIFDKPHGCLWVVELGRAKWTIELEISSEKGIHCTGSQSGYFIDINQKRPVPLPGELINRYKAAGGN